MEQLSDEILLIICSYLRSVDIFYAFNDLNLRLNRIIQQFKYHIIIDFSNISYKQYEYCCQLLKFYPLLHKNIYSLKLSNKMTPGQIELFYDHFLIQNTFTNLKYLTLIDSHLSSIKLFSLLNYFKNLKIFHLFTDDNNNDIDYIELLYNQYKLENILLYIKNGIYIPFINKISQYSIKQLKITLKTMLDLIQLLKINSNILTLEANIYSNHFDISHFSYSIPNFSNLINFHYKTLENKSINFIIFSFFINKLSSLQNLTVDIDTYDISYTNGHCWKDTFEKLINLNKFSCSIRYHLINTHKPPCINYITQSFLTDFWIIKKQWHIYSYIDNSESMKLLILHTIPYTCQIFQTSLISSINNNIDYSHVKYLLLCVPSVNVSMTHFCHIIKHFQNINKLKLSNNLNRLYKNEILLNENLFITMTKLTHLIITKHTNTVFFLQLIMMIPNLSKLTIGYNEILPLIQRSIIYNDDTIKNILERIKYLKIIVECYYDNTSKINIIQQLSNLFINVEYLKFKFIYSIWKDEHLLLIEKYFNKLIYFQIDSHDLKKNKNLWYKNDEKMSQLSRNRVRKIVHFDLPITSIRNRQDNIDIGTHLVSQKNLSSLLYDVKPAYRKSNDKSTQSMGNKLLNLFKRQK